MANLKSRIHDSKYSAFMIVSHHYLKVVCCWFQTCWFPAKIKYVHYTPIHWIYHILLRLIFSRQSKSWVIHRVISAQLNVVSWSGTFLAQFWSLRINLKLSTIEIIRAVPNLVYVNQFVWQQEMYCRTSLKNLSSSPSSVVSSAPLTFSR